MIILPLPPSVNNLFINVPKRGRVISPRYRAWRESCPLLLQRYTTPVRIEYTYAWPDRRKRDGQSYQKAALDYIVSQGVLPDDHYEIVVSESWRHVGIDKENPRVEIKIIPVDIND